MSEIDDVDEVDAPQGPVRPALTPAQRRARRQAITLIVVCGLLLVSFLFAAAYYGGWFDQPKNTANTPCQTAPTTTLKPSQIKVNVYNASKRNGLARKVAGEMKDRGFVVGSIANDPLHRTLTTTAEVRYGTKGKAGAQLVSSEVPGAKLVADKRKDASVDLVLGSTYVDLTATATPTAGSSPTCTPTGTATTSGTGTKTASASKTTK